MKTPTKQALASLARDFAALAKKHKLTNPRLYPDGMESEHLMLNEGQMLSYRQPKAVWTRLAAVDKRFAASASDLATNLNRIRTSGKKVQRSIVKLTNLISKS